MLGNIPAELLLNILSYVENLGPVASTNHHLSQATRDVRVHELRSRLARIRHIELLMRTWSPPMYFGRRQQTHLSRPQDLHNILMDPTMSSYVEHYIGTLERNLAVAEAVADHVRQLVSFNSLRTDQERRDYATVIVIELWSAQPRYSHDVDGRWDIGDNARTEDFIRDSHVQLLPQHIQSSMISVYNELAEHLRPPFTSSHRRGGAVWLYRRILKDGMEGVLNLLNQRAHR